MDITPYFLAFVLGLGLWLLWVTRRDAKFFKEMKRLDREGFKEGDPGKAWRWYMTTSRWQKQREACLKAFYYRCAECGSPHNLQAHHRTREAYKKYLGREKPIRDLTCLCRDCHAKAPRSDGLYKD